MPLFSGDFGLFAYVVKNLRVGLMPRIWAQITAQIAASSKPSIFAIALNSYLQRTLAGSSSGRGCSWFREWSAAARDCVLPARMLLRFST
jgi:hypothetical protein